MKNKKMPFGIENIIFVIIFAVIAVSTVTSVRQIHIKQQAEALRSAEETILKGVITCYALEGSYPSSYEYLKENYGISVDENRFNVFYDIFASNIMPDVTVIEK